MNDSSPDTLAAGKDRHRVVSQSGFLVSRLGRRFGFSCYERATNSNEVCNCVADLCDMCFWTKLRNERQSKDRIFNAASAGASSSGETAKGGAARRSRASG